MAGGEPCWVEQHAQLPPSPTDNGGFRDLMRLLYRVIHLGDQAPQREVVVARAVERQREDRHVVDRLRLDEWSAHTWGDAIVVRTQLFGEPHKAALDIFADKETDDELAFSGTRGRVDILHTRNFPEQLLHRAGGALLDLLCAEPRHGHQHID